uniref:Trehalase n=1 Tax=Rhabditophanes sp. KR3021 TaxID=114890 RepID=A0AC35U6E3_9BILA
MPSENKPVLQMFDNLDVSPDFTKGTDLLDINQNLDGLTLHNREVIKTVFEEPSVIKGIIYNDMRFNIYCTGSLLDSVQKFRLFKDCKHFVDMPLKEDAAVVFNKWTKLVLNSGDIIEKAAVETFVRENFDEPGVELEHHIPTDFNIIGENLKQIIDSDYRNWALNLHSRWPSLCRKVKQTVLDNVERYSLIALPNPFVVPGGRFNEIYYWDSFFIIKGLLASKMFKTVRNMIDNMGFMIDEFGFIPNGNRVYYLNRSQPPLMSWCIDAYYKETGDLEYAEKALPWIEKELVFFRNNRSVQLEGWKSHLYRFQVNVDTPRPESYREDIETSDHCTDLKTRQNLWGEIAAAAESGRDFSSRWFSKQGDYANRLQGIRTSQVLPVDLNAIIVLNLNIASEINEALGNYEKAERFRQERDALKDMVHEILWNADLGSWFDYDLENKHPILTYFDTNFFPLVTGCRLNESELSQLVSYISKNGLLKFPGGIPTSLVDSGEQWDFPNAWAPTTWVLVEGLRIHNQHEMAKEIADKWLKKNYIVWKDTDGKMFEKYNVTTSCAKNIAGGGEYEIQEGFGWTNGVILDLLMKYKDEAKYEIEENQCKACDCRKSSIIIDNRDMSFLEKALGAGEILPILAL